MQTLTKNRIVYLRNLHSYLTSRIIGQEQVIPRVVSVIHRGELGLASPGRPLGSFLFLGPTGVGKTELTIEFTRYLFGSERLFRFDMSEYQTQESLGILLGGRIGETGLLAKPAMDEKGGTLLFDEIEKAHPRVLDVLLQILDAARVTMASGQTLDFSNFYIVLTSNIGGAELLQLAHSSFTTMQRHVLAKAQNTLRPELVARITEKLVFNRLTYDVQLKIAQGVLDKELKRLRSKGFEVTADASVLPFLVRHGYHPRLGARPMRDTVEKLVRDGVVSELLEGNPIKGRLSVSGDELTVVSPQAGCVT